MLRFKYESIAHFLSPGETPPTMRLDRTDEEEKLVLPSSATRKADVTSFSGRDAQKYAQVY